MMALNVARYVGIPYKERGRSAAGADCWGICLMFAREQLRVELPEYFYSEADLLEAAPRLIERATRPGGRWVQVERPALGDVAVFRIKGLPTHCGLVLVGGLFLHSLPGRNATVESLNDLDWTNRLIGCYRWTLES